MATTKAFHAFKTKLNYFDDDLETIDYLRDCILGGKLSNSSEKHVFIDINPQSYKHLSRRKNTDGARELIANHLRKTLYSAYVKDVYEETTHYLRTILRGAATNGFKAGQLIGEHSSKLDMKEVLAAGTWEHVAGLVADSVFQSLESEKSTLDLFEKMSNKLGLGIEDQLIQTALPYLEVRHYLVHADGKLPAKFKNEHPEISTQKETGKVKLDREFALNFKTRITQLLAAIDTKVIEKNLLPDSHKMS
jgi:hypothetical protein